MVNRLEPSSFERGSDRSMRAILMLFAVLSFTCLPGTDPAAQPTCDMVPQGAGRGSGVYQASGKLTKEEQKFSRTLFKALTDYEQALSEGKSRSEAVRLVQSRYTLEVDTNYRIHVLMWTSRGSENQVSSEVTARGGVAIHAGDKEVDCWIPIDALRDLASLREVGAIEEPLPPPVTY